MNLFMYRQPVYSKIYINKIWKPERNFSSDWTNDNYFPNALIIENIWAEYFIYFFSFGREWYCTAKEIFYLHK